MTALFGGLSISFRLVWAICPKGKDEFFADSTITVGKRIVAVHGEPALLQYPNRGNILLRDTRIERPHSHLRQKL